MIRVYVDQLMCTGSAVCETIAPQVFAIDEQGLATVISGGVPLPDGADPEGVEVSGEDEILVRDAEAACPGGCIHIVA